MQIQGKVKIDNIVTQVSKSNVSFSTCRINEGIKQKDNTYKNCSFQAVAFKNANDTLVNNQEGYYYIIGNVEDNNYKDKNGSMIYAKKVIINVLYKIADFNNTNQNAPFNYQQSNNQTPFYNQNEVSDDDLPF